MHHKLSHPINSGHHVQQANLRLQANNGGIESPFRRESGREIGRISRRLKKHQPTTYASSCINSGPPFHPAITVQPAHHNQFNHSTEPTTACAQVHTMEINSGRKILPDRNSKVNNFASVNQKHHPPVVWPIFTSSKTPANPATSRPMTKGSYKCVTPISGSTDM